MDFTVSSISWPAASRREADPLNTGVTKVWSTFSSRSFVALIFTSLLSALAGAWALMLAYIFFDRAKKKEC